jgi:hypothetical protein
MSFSSAVWSSQNWPAMYNANSPLPVSNYTQLRALAAQDIRLAYVTGVYGAAAPEGVAGLFVRDDDDTTTADNGGTVLVASNGKRWKRYVTGASYNVQWFGAKGDGNTDDTAAIQAALDSGGTAVYCPAPTDSYLCGGLTMPNVFNFVLHGDGPSSVFRMKADGSALFKWSTAAMVYNEQTIRNIGVIGTAGTGHCVDTSGAGGLTIHGLYITDVPVAKSGIYLNGTAATQTHDVRIENLQIYSNTAGHSGVRCGPLAADSMLINFIMNATHNVDYCLYFDSGVRTIEVVGGHPYNAKVNVFKVAGDSRACSFNGVVFDNALDDVCDFVTLTNSTFLGCYFEAIAAGFCGVDLQTTCQGLSFIGCRWQGNVGTLSAIRGDASSNTIQAIGGTISTSTDYITPFDFAGADCWARGIGGHNPLAVQTNMSGSTVAAQGAGTTVYIGANGSQAIPESTVFIAPYDMVIDDIYIATNDTPGVGQTYTFTLMVNSIAIPATTVTINNGSFGATATLNYAVAENDTIAIRSVFSAGATPAYIRWRLRSSS